MKVVLPALVSVAELHAALPKGAVTEAQLRKLIEQSGCYRAIGKEPVMTQLDIEAFLSWCSPRRLKGEIDDETPGKLVVLSSPTNRDSLVFIGFAENELALLDTIQEGYPERLAVTTYASMTAGEAKRVREELKQKSKNNWCYGFWYNPTPDVLGWIEQLDRGDAE